jgi:hypothetical protein
MDALLSPVGRQGLTPPPRAAGVNVFTCNAFTGNDATSLMCRSL